LNSAFDVMEPVFELIASLLLMVLSSPSI